MLSGARVIFQMLQIQVFHDGQIFSAQTMVFLNVWMLFVYARDLFGDTFFSRSYDKLICYQRNLFVCSLVGLIEQ